MTDLETMLTRIECAAVNGRPKDVMTMYVKDAQTLCRIARASIYLARGDWSDHTEVVLARAALLKTLEEEP